MKHKCVMKRNVYPMGHFYCYCCYCMNTISMLSYKYVCVCSCGFYKLCVCLCMDVGEYAYVEEKERKPQSYQVCPMHHGGKLEPLTLTKHNNYYE